MTAGALILSAVLAAASPPAARRTVGDCVAIAIRGSGQVAEAQGKVSEWKARLAEVESTFYPKITALAYAAPSYGVTGTALTPEVKNDWGRWGPILHFEGLLAQPIYTFGRVAAGEEAARERVAVEKARLDQTRNAVALEVHRYYFLHLFVKSVGPALKFAGKILDEAQTKAKQYYEEGTGKVTNVDVNKLHYAATELEKFRVQIEIGLPLSLAALKHTMALPESEPLELADDLLPALEPTEPPPAEELIKLAWEKRPELSQLRHGQKAALALGLSERKANWPVLLLAGQLTAAWCPVRTSATNPYWYDPYNTFTGDVALALRWEFDPAKAKARSDAAQALSEQVDGLEKFASTGIPLEVRKAHDDLVQARRLAALSEEGSTAARKWMTFAAVAFASGTGETRDVLEGIAAYVSSRRAYYDALMTAHLARAQVDWAVGTVAEGR
jgi:outer membrane protein TolC